MSLGIAVLHRRHRRADLRAPGVGDLRLLPAGRRGAAERREGDRHRIDVEVRRRGVTIRSRQAFVLSPGAPSRKSPNESLRDTLASPFAVSGLPLRVTTFAHQDPASDKVRLTIAAQVGQPGAAKGEFTLGYILIIPGQTRLPPAAGNKVALSPLGSSAQRAAGVRGSRAGRSRASTRCASASWTRRAAEAAWCARCTPGRWRGEALAFGDLIVGSAGAGAAPARRAVEPYVSGEALGAYLELYSNAPATFDSTVVTFDIADDADSPRADQPGRPGAARLAADDAGGVRRDAAVAAAARPLRGARAGLARRQGGRRAGPAVRAGARGRCHGPLGDDAHGGGQVVRRHAAGVRSAGGARARLRGRPARHRREAFGHVEGRDRPRRAPADTAPARSRR